MAFDALGQYEPKPIDLLAQPGQNDIAWQFITTIYPSGQYTPFTMASFYFNAALCIVAMIFLSYYVMHFLVQSARSGYVGGKEFNNIYGPLRIAFGFASLVPIFFGLNGAQMLVHLHTRVGTNMGNMVALIQVDQTVKEGKPIANTEIGGHELVLKIVRGEVCRTVFNAKVEKVWMPFGDTANRYFRPLPPVGGEDVKGILVDGKRWDYGPECGAITINMPKTETGFETKRYEAVKSVIGSVRTGTEGAGQVGGSIAQAYVELYGNGLGTHGDAREENVVAGDKAEPIQVKAMLENGYLKAHVAPVIKKAGDTYDAAVIAAAAEETSKVNAAVREKLVENIKDQGWVAMAVYPRALVQAGALTANLAGEKPAYREPNRTTWKSFGAQMKLVFEVLDEQIKIESEGVGLSANDLAFAGDESMNWLAKGLAKLSRPLMEYAISIGKNPSNDPTGDSIQFGNIVVIATENTVALLAAATILTHNLASDSLGADGPVTFLTPLILAIIKFVWIIGVLNAHILPMIPVIHVIFGFLGWLLMVATATIAASIWAFLFIRMEGKDFFDGPHKAGSIMLLNVMLHPPLMMLGYGLALMLDVPLQNFINKIFPLAFAGQSGGSLNTISGLLVSYAIYLYLKWHVRMRLYGLIMRVPYMAMEYVGSRLQGFGEDGANTTIGGLASINQQGGNQVTGSLGAGHKANEDAKKDRLEQERRGKLDRVMSRKRT
ncbi:hypothetical protein BB934_45480 (plasmid) [Microvirga ossetica]|uniref:DotA/TraY family protein n=1 Tax=Microvirga ossetica TaxID=1882682 RepID=A0A1B2EZW0_9HYPH|nr:DotA/TraY family protein [Microvirga ossetica]ANY85474.1 hypothetical protein BB934_45480 [Microvirga ossetica]